MSVLGLIDKASQFVYGQSNERRENGDRKDRSKISGEIGEYLVSSKQMTWLCTASRKNT